MANHNSTPITPELKDRLDKFDTYLWTHFKISTPTVALNIGIVRRAHAALGFNPSNGDIENYIASLRREDRLSASSISTICTGLERYCQFLGHPIELSRPPKEELEVPHTLSEGEMAIFLNSCHTIRVKAMLALLAYTGVRNKELCCLRVRDIDLGNGLVRVELGKHHKERLCAVPGDCMALMVEYMKERGGNPNDYLFVTKRHGLQMEQQDIRKTVRVVAKAAGFKRRIWPHLFRHSLATNMIDRGAHLLTVKDQLGHEYVDSTMVYIHRSKKSHSNDYRQHAPSYT